MTELFLFTMSTYLLTIIAAAVISFVCVAIIKPKMSEEELQKKATAHTRILYPIITFVTTVGAIRCIYGTGLPELQYLKLLFFGTTGTMVLRSLITFTVYQCKKGTAA